MTSAGNSDAPQLSLKPNHKPVKAYYTALGAFEKLGIKHEGAVASAFEDLLDYCARQVGRILIPKYALKRRGAPSIIPDAAVVDSLSRVLTYGFWEAKDTDDDLDQEIKAKFKARYPRDNILFQEPRRAVLYQNGERFFDADITDPSQLIHVLKLFFAWRPPAFAVWERAVDEFKDRVPELGRDLGTLISKERKTNARYRSAFADFVRLCRASLNPSLSESAVEEMIIQHLLTERIFRKVFDIGDFMQRNVVAREIEKVIAALTSRNFSRDKFSASLEHFYIAIEQAAETITAFDEKQKFLNTIYEQFFQGFAVRVADTHGIVYTPQPIVDFMVASVQHVLATEFGAALGDENVPILDPFTGTGNFVVNIMRRLPKTTLPRKYRSELFCNEVMLLPYYVASMNIEHAYWEATGEYEPFEGVCLVDTFETAEDEQHALEIFNEANAERVERQRRSPIKVIIANPPYNAGQVNENDNNKNRKYPTIDTRVHNTYSADSRARLHRKLGDPYVKAIRFASDRIGDAGIVCYVNNDSFVEERTFDGMRKHLGSEFDVIYVVDLGGNVRKHPELSGTTHNAFGIQVGVSINLFVRLTGRDNKTRSASIFYHTLPTHWRREEKYDFLSKAASIAGIRWTQLHPDDDNNWLTDETDSEYQAFMPIGSSAAKAGETLPDATTVFRTYSLGVSTNRDAVVYGFDADQLETRIGRFADAYNAEMSRWRAHLRHLGKVLPTGQELVKQVDDFVDYSEIKWSRNLKRAFRQGVELQPDSKAVRESAYRPFTTKYLHFQRVFVDEVATVADFLPNDRAHDENVLLLVPSAGARSPFWCFATNLIPNLNFVSIDSCQCFPLYVYGADGEHRQGNVDPTALTQFRMRYGNEQLTAQDVAHYVYGVLHHPEYRMRYAAKLRQDLPRIPLMGTDTAFWSVADAGRRLLDLHVHYDRQPEYSLTRVEGAGARLDWRVETMKLGKDRTELRYNDFLTLYGIPPEVFDFHLGNRSALEWIIDQYRVERDADGEIVSDPNRAEDPSYILRLIGQVITVSLETVRIWNSLPDLNLPTQYTEHQPPARKVAEPPQMKEESQ